LLFAQFFNVAKHFETLHAAFTEHEVVISDKVHHEGFFLVSARLSFGVTCFQLSEELSIEELS